MKHFSIHLQISFVLLSKNSLLEERCKKKSRDSHHRTSISDLCECLLPLEAVNIV